jgi:hypothetical protein
MVILGRWSPEEQWPIEKADGGVWLVTWMLQALLQVIWLAISHGRFEREKWWRGSQRQEGNAKRMSGLVFVRRIGLERVIPLPFIQ